MERCFAGAAPTLQPGRCLNRRHVGANCTRCVDGCPAQAVTLNGATPTLDETTCVHCGVCTAICPTDSFVPTVDYEKTLRATVANLPAAPTALVCPVHPTPDATTVAVNAIVQHRRCLAALDVADWLELSASGTRPLWIDDSPCADCPIGAAQATLKRTVEAARTLLHAAGRPPALLLHSEQPPAADAKLRHASLYDGAQPAISRRALFTRLRPGQSKQEEPVLDDLLNRGAPLSARLPQQTPASRRRLLAALAALPTAATTEFVTQRTPFGVVDVDADHCSGCGLCARFCPTGALHFNVETAHFGLTFQPAACIACDICVVACPEGAVNHGAAVALSAINTNAVTTLAEGDLVTCHSCGVQTAKLADDPAPRCHACRHGAGVVSVHRDDAGLMVDLLKRTFQRSEPDIV
ncbi:MAG: 4Fe-4S dicluster domain-containing protein [Caldilinea sp.]